MSLAMQRESMRWSTRCTNSWSPLFRQNGPVDINCFFFVCLFGWVDEERRTLICLFIIVSFSGQRGESTRGAHCSGRKSIESGMCLVLLIDNNRLVLFVCLFWWVDDQGRSFIGLLSIILSNQIEHLYSVYIYIYIYIYRERERERETHTEKERESIQYSIYIYIYILYIQAI